MNNAQKELLISFAMADHKVIVISKNDDIRFFIAREYVLPNKINSTSLKINGKEITELFLSQTTTMSFASESQRKSQLDALLESIQLIKYEFSEGYNFEIISI